MNVNAKKGRQKESNCIIHESQVKEGVEFACPLLSIPRDFLSGSSSTPLPPPTLRLTLNHLHPPKKPHHPQSFFRSLLRTYTLSPLSVVGPSSTPPIDLSVSANCDVVRALLERMMKISRPSPTSMCRSVADVKESVTRANTLCKGKCVGCAPETGFWFLKYI